MNHVETPEERTARITARPGWMTAPRVVRPKPEPVEKLKIPSKEPAAKRRAKYLQGVMSNYHLTLAEVIRLSTATDGICPVCEQQFKGQDPVLDHDHATGKIRAFICIACNSGLGFFRDSPKTMRRAARYVKGTLR